jgi:hypothetical protein
MCFKFLEKIKHYLILPLKNTGDTLKGPDGTVLITDHWVFYE